MNDFMEIYVGITGSKFVLALGLQTIGSCYIPNIKEKGKRVYDYDSLKKYTYIEPCRNLLKLLDELISILKKRCIREVVIHTTGIQQSGFIAYRIIAPILAENGIKLLGISNHAPVPHNGYKSPYKRVRNKENFNMI